MRRGNEAVQADGFLSDFDGGGVHGPSQREIEGPPSADLPDLQTRSRKLQHDCLPPLGRRRRKWAGGLATDTYTAAISPFHSSIFIGAGHERCWDRETSACALGAHVLPTMNACARRHPPPGWAGHEGGSRWFFGGLAARARARTLPGRRLPRGSTTGSNKSGEIVGSEWRVLRAMEGGLGLVYAVEHRESGERRVLKAPKRQSDAAVRESFRTEAETWVRLGDHPNIVCADGVDEFAGQLFVIAELIEPDELGRVSLRDYLTTGAPTPRAVAALTADFCYGMAHARSKGMVAHRDIKPENLLIGAAAKLRVTDFGLARAMVLGAGSDEDRSAKLGGWQTFDGKIAGTPFYMSPEQWQGGRQDVTTDIYAFGVVMYEMCYGRLPFTGAQLRDLAAQHIGRQPEIPDGMFAPVIVRCLAKEPAARFPDTLALLAELARLCGGRGIPLPPKPVISGQKARELAALARGLSAVGKPEEALAAVRQLVEIEFRNRRALDRDGPAPLAGWR